MYSKTKPALFLSFSFLVFLFASCGNDNKSTTNKNESLEVMRQTNTINEKFGSREPRTCDNKKAPEDGAITADLAKQYFICQAEGVWGAEMYLVDNVELEVGGGVPYHPTLGAFDAIDVNLPLYPIRGSYIKYQCRNLQTAHTGAPGTNCTIYKNPNATGYCYKDTFGDWHCYMADRSNSAENIQVGVAPPGN